MKTQFLFFLSVISASALAAPGDWMACTASSPSGATMSLRVDEDASGTLTASLQKRAADGATVDFPNLHPIGKLDGERSMFVFGDAEALQTGLVRLVDMRLEGLEFVTGGNPWNAHLKCNFNFSYGKLMEVASQTVRDLNLYPDSVQFWPFSRVGERLIGVGDVCINLETRNDGFDTYTDCLASRRVQFIFSADARTLLEHREL